ncbi:Leucine Rich Repeat [Seminavis robusta]|uniref:Leucine Rich Repeat n=1 Tax=Seminavis robusta TaxID=568900 RepID=A0A9N8F000_9STRA|nr:Leucine Rich Repeat [Seminavis robusta]|eukprot:Sro2089_g313940.1 Leucine Rich Repeat (560) ;mRNA; f:3086-4765
MSTEGDDAANPKLPAGIPSSLISGDQNEMLHSNYLVETKAAKLDNRQQPGLSPTKTDEKTMENSAAAKDKEASNQKSESGDSLTERPNVMSLGNIVEDIQALNMAINAMEDEESPPGAFAIGGPGAHRGSASSLVIYSSVRASQSDPVHIDDAHLVALDEESAPADNTDGSHHSSNTELVEGKVLGRRQQDKQGRWIGWVAILGCAVLAVVLMLVFLVGRSDGELKETTMSASSTFTQDQAPYPPFHDDLPALVTTGILENRYSPFYHANEWVMKDPNFSIYAKERNLQRFYLAMMYHATNGDSWLDNENWLSYEVSECNWFTKSSFATSSKFYEANVCENSTVINLSLPSNNLTGTFPIWYTYFIPSLKILDLGYNPIAGALPPITSTPEIEVFVVCHTELEGAPIINAGAYFPALKVMRIDHSKIRRSNKGALQYLTPNLEVTNVTGNLRDKGPMFSSMGLLTHLEYLGNGHRGFLTSTIVTEIGLARSLLEIDWSSNPRLEGTIPSELGQLAHLRKLDLTDTPVTGQVPVEVCKRVQAGQLELLLDCGTQLECCVD